jgi:hypothetical protein
MPMFTRGANAGYLAEAEIPLSARDKLRVGHEFRIAGWPMSAARLRG